MVFKALLTNLGIYTLLTLPHLLNIITHGQIGFSYGLAGCMVCGVISGIIGAILAYRYKSW